MVTAFASPNGAALAVKFLTRSFDIPGAANVQDLKNTTEFHALITVTSTNYCNESDRHISMGPTEPSTMVPVRIDDWNEINQMNEQCDIVMHS